MPSPSPIHSGSAGCCLGPFGITTAVTDTLVATIPISASGSVRLRTGRYLHARTTSPAPGGARARHTVNSGACLQSVGAWLATTGPARRLLAPGVGGAFVAVWEAPDAASLVSGYYERMEASSFFLKWMLPSTSPLCLVRGRKAQSIF